MIISAFAFLEPIGQRDQVIMQYLNEGHVLLITYHLYLFTDFMPDVNVREVVGVSF